jgi:hypothetical protein
MNAREEAHSLLYARGSKMAHMPLICVWPRRTPHGGTAGCRRAWWTLDHAARAGYQHVRRGCGYPELMRYYRDIQGWQLAHIADRHGVTAYLLTRPAELQPGLAGRITELHSNGDPRAAPAASDKRPA